MSQYHAWAAYREADRRFRKAMRYLAYGSDGPEAAVLLATAALHNLESAARALAESSARTARERRGT